MDRDPASGFEAWEHFTDGRGEPLVSDFGLAKWLDTSSHLTRTLTIFGTPGYIAPEQVTDRRANLVLRPIFIVWVRFCFDC